MSSAGSRRSRRSGPEDDASLRERAATALERALAFVDAHGDALARLRARALLLAEPRERAADAVAALQRPDGSFPRLGASLAEAEGEFSSGALAADVLGTLDALAALAGLRALHHPCVAPAVRHLARVQGGDGSWGGGDERDRIAATAMLGGLLARTGVARPEWIRGAADFVAERSSPDELEGASGARVASAAQLFSNADHDRADEILQWCGRELERGFRTGRIEALAVASALVACEAAALPGFAATPRELLAALLDEQASDGGFAALAPGGPPARVVPSLDALLSILALCSAF